MHPPDFHTSHLLSDWPNCFLEAHCFRCMRRRSVSSIRSLMREHGNVSFTELLSRLKCRFFLGKPTLVHLCASQVRTCMGPPTGWAIELYSRQTAESEIT